MRLVYSPEALDDLKIIKLYIEHRFGKDKSLKALRDLKDSIRKLVQYPNLGHSLNGIIDIATNYRYLVIKPNYIIYSINSDDVRIVRILNEKQDFLENLFGIPSDGEDYWSRFD